MAPNFSDGLVTPPGTTRFHTVTFVTAAYHGDGTTGFVDLFFCTPDDQTNYITCLSPEGVRQLASQLAGVVALMPKLPETPAVTLGGRLQGDITYGPRTKTYFGQNYDVKVIQAMGVLMLRANLIDQLLIEINSLILGTSLQMATSQYYASVNMKARLDSIRSIIGHSGLSDIVSNQIRESLDYVKQVSDRRNDLVHARWSMRKGKHRAQIFRPNSKVKFSEITVTEKHVLDIADSYAMAHTELLLSISSIRQYRDATAKTADTPSSTDPSS